MPNDMTPLLMPAQVEHPQDVAVSERPFRFDEESQTFRQLRQEYEPELQATLNRRALRDNKKNVAELRASKQLLPDETIIPDRTIDMAIRQDRGPFIAYLEQPQSVLSFHNPADPLADYSSLSDWTTGLFRYTNWQHPWHLMIDAMLTHGAGFHEVIFSPGEPQKFLIECVRREHLIFPRDTRDIQACTRIARCYELTKHQLKLLTATYGFNPAVVSQIEEHYRSRSTFIKIYKYFLRDDTNTVYVAWLAEDTLGATDWLRAPMPHFNGDYSDPDPVTGAPAARPTTVFPFFAFPYRIQEDEAILLSQGLTAQLVHVQEAVMGLVSATVNTAVRASGLYAARVPAPGTTPDSKELYPLKHGYVHDGDLSFHSLPWPNPVALSVIQMLSVRAAQQQGQTDFAAMSRQDTAKRATEILAAKEESQALKTADIALFSRLVFQEYLFCLNIIKNQIKIGQITPPPSLDIRPLFDPSIIPSMSADVEVVKREQRKQLYVQFWPLAANSPMAGPYFQTMFKELFPQEFDKWQQESLESQKGTDLLQAAAAAMTAVDPNSLPPELRQQFIEILNQIPKNDTEGPTSDVAPGQSDGGLASASIGPAGQQAAPAV